MVITAATSTDQDDHTYDYFIIGTGPAGQSVATAAAKAGKRVAVADYQPYGGTCPLRGCDPKKILYAAARAMNAVERLKGKGFGARPPFSWADLQAWKREFTEPIPEGTHDNFTELGITQYEGIARFLEPHHLAIGDKEKVRAEHVIIATGAIPAPLDFPGAELMLTSADFLDLEELPESMIIVGGGYIGAEFAHIATLLGCRVHVIASEELPVAKFDHDLSALLAKAAAERGMDLHFKSEAKKVTTTDEGVCVEAEKEDGTRFSLTAACAVHCAGRVPNIAHLDLDAAGIAHDEEGIAVSDDLSTCVRAHFAVGDCANTGLALTPVGTHEAQIVVDNLLHGKQRTIDYYPIPTLAFTLPPIAAVGMTAEEAKKRTRPTTINYEETTDWFSTKHANTIVSGYKVILDQETGKVLGAHLLGPEAAEVINLFTLAIHREMTRDEIRQMIWAYPTAGANIGSMMK